MKKYDAVPAVPQRPDRTHRYADLMLPASGLVLGLTLAAFVWGAGLTGLPLAPAVFGGWFFGLVAPRLYHHRFRVLGWVPVAGAFGWVTATLAVVLDAWSPWVLAAFAFLEGVVLGSVLRYRDRVSHGRLGYNLAGVSAFVAVAVAVWGFESLGERSDEARANIARLLPVVTGLLTVLSVVLFARPLVELFAEPMMQLGYKVDAAGPGLKALPMHGPLLVIANHAAFFDPFFVAEVLPRAITPMMTANVYDKPGIRFLMRRVFHVIRVPEVGARRAAPEIQEAIDALDHGKMVVIFPEGFLRRTEEQVIRRFGRGVWQVLAARPATPVVALWIEGTWGSYFSHFNGPPTTNKPRDFRRPVRVGVSVPVVVPKELLADHIQTRFYLMNQVLAARAHIGLPEVPAVELPTSGGGDD